MRLTRTSVLVVVTIILLAMAVPAAQAQAIEKPQPVLHSQGEAWLVYSLENALDRAMSWLTRLTSGEPRTVMTAKTSSTSGTGNGIGNTIGPLTGSCIDPNGVGRCN